MNYPPAPIWGHQAAGHHLQTRFQCTMYPMYSSSVSKFPVSVSRSLESVSSMLGWLLLRPRHHPITTNPEVSQDLGWPRITLKTYQTSWQSLKQKKSWKLVPRIFKIWKLDPGSMRYPDCAKGDFCNTSHTKNWLFQSQTSKFRPKNDQKKKPGNQHKKIHIV